jgi:sugar fermentation stimulation protein A
MHRLLQVDHPIECTIVQRLNRFVVEALIDGQRHRAWINNTGRLTEFMVQGRRAFCLRRNAPGRTTHRLFAVREGIFGALIDTHFQMKAFETCLRKGLLPWVEEADGFRRNARLGQSLVDYWLPESKLFLEVKSAVLRNGAFAMYPDCPSARGRKHIRELTGHAMAGGRACILFVAALPDVKAFRPNAEADAELSSLLFDARSAGVDLHSIAVVYAPGEDAVLLSNADLPVELNPQSRYPLFELTSRRLTLIPLDEENLRLAIDHPAQMEANLGLRPQGAEPEPELREALQQMLAGVLRDRHNQLWYTHWQIVERRRRRLVGGLCFKGPPNTAGVVEVGYGLSPEYEGRGYMTEALQTIVGWAFQQAGVKAIVAETERANKPSHRLLQRLGFAPHEEKGQSVWWRLARTGHADSQASVP